MSVDKTPQLPIEVQSNMTLVPQTKVCFYCEKEKPLSDFQLDRGNPHHICKVCHSNVNKIRHQIAKTAPPRPKICDCCGRDPSSRSKGKLLMDHDHETNKFRGWICDLCNLGIGKLGDNLEGLLKAVKYLKRTTAINTTNVLDMDIKNVQ